MNKQLTKGNEAIVKAAVLAGCRAFYGYPITPASEIAEAAALYLPQAGGVFVQAESEVSAINMLYGGAAAGVRAMTASSGPGISLMQEGFSYLAGAELPCVIADIMRGGPGLGNIAPEQGDYNQIVKGGGHGNYQTLVLAPDSVQEMADLTTWAFDLADRVPQPGGRARRWIYRADDGAGRVRAAPRRPPSGVMGGHRHGRTSPQSGELRFSSSPTCWSAHSQTGSEVSRGRADCGARRMLAYGGCRVRAGGLRHRGADPQSGGGAGPRPRDQGRAAAAHHACIRSRRARSAN